MFRIHLTILLILTCLHGGVRAQGTKADYDRANALRSITSDTVWPRPVEPHWAADGTHLWYVRRMKDSKTFIRVDLPSGKRGPAFDHQQLAAELSKAKNKTFPPGKLPFHQVDCLADGGVRFSAVGSDWMFVQGVLSVSEEKPNERSTKKPDQPRKRSYRPPQGADSPDGKWTAYVEKFNVYLRDRQSGESSALTTDGKASDGYTPRFAWSPNSSRLIVWRTAPGQERLVHLIETAPKDQVQPRLHNYRYRKPGDRIDITKPRLFDAAAQQEIPLKDALYPNPWSIRDGAWSSDSKRFTFLYNQRGHQILRVLAIDADQGEVSTLIEETSDTFIDYAFKTFYRRLEETNELLWMSERDGWNHLYLFDAQSGKLKQQITQGEWVVRNVERVDVEKRQIWFRAMGIDPAQDPYHIHFCRIDFSGKNLVRLSEGDGSHKLTYSPDQATYLDTYSRVDLPPVTELRRTSDGQLLAELERSDWSQLLATGWKPPQRFTAKGRDGRTDIYGVIYRPTNFEEEKTYPVIEQIYAGPHGAFAPKEFRNMHGPQRMAELGFIVVQIDGMGTNWRSKAFHNVCWKNLKDSGFPDRIAWIKAAAKAVPQMDLTRVGIFGGSAGGQSTLSGLLHHGDFYTVGVADCGCHDNRMDKIWWNEAWMGWPLDESYAANSNVTHAHRLQGKLFLTLGELDRNVDPASTMQVVDALIKADKDFDLLIVPGAGHGVGESRYANRRRQDFFVRHLHGVEPRKD